MKQLLKKLRWKWHRDVTTLMGEDQRALLAKIDEDYTALSAKIDRIARNFDILIPQTVMQTGEQIDEQTDIDTVASLLQDEESRKLFSARLQYSKNGTLAPLYRYLMESERTGNPVDIISFLRNRLNTAETDDELVVYGTTWANMELFKAVKELGCRIDFVCEAKSPDWLRLGEDPAQYDWMGVPIITEKELFRHHKNAQIITGFIASSDAKDYLMEKGIPSDHIWVRHTQWEPQYLAPDIVHPHEHEVYIDGGVLDLQNTAEFIDWCHGEYSAVYAFEPDLRSYQTCLNRIETDPAFDSSRVHLLHAALWREDTTLNFEDGHGGGSNINSGGNSAVQGRSIDSVLQGAPVTFIKLDIEGAEMDALIGARESIQRWKPRLAICIYHKPNDPIDIPLYIHELVPEYKMYIRHYSTCSAETVLYCICDEH